LRWCMWGQEGRNDRRNRHKHLHGKRIRLMEASREYDVEHSNLLRWADRGYIQIVDQDKLRMELDRAGVAYVSALFKRAIELTESPIRAGWVLKRLLA
jgi:hypothetical protein